MREFKADMVRCVAPWVVSVKRRERYSIIGSRVQLSKTTLGQQSHLAPGESYVPRALKGFGVYAISLNKTLSRETCNPISPVHLTHVTP